jgi:hypothetical protein
MKTTRKAFCGGFLSSIWAIGLTCVSSQLAAQEIIAGTQALQANADPGGTRVIWRRLVGIVVPDSIVGRRNGELDGGCDVGVTCVLGAPAPWTVTDGRAEVNLSNGMFTFTVRGLVLADDFNAANIGTPSVVTRVKGTLVCNDGEPGFGELVDTEAVRLSKTGNATFSGRVDLPATCTEEPEDIVFVIRIADVTEFEEVIGLWNAFGAVRVIHHPSH